MAGSADPIWMSIWRAKWPKLEKTSNFTLFMLGGTGARPTKDGLSTTGFPSGVGGVPTEIAETQAPLIQQHRSLKTDSGGPGRYRGGLGQNVTIRQRGHDEWSVSGMVDRTKFAAEGLEGGQSGAVGEFQLNEEPAPPKTIMWMEADAAVSMNPPGGGGFGSPFERDPKHVLADVVEGYVSIEAAKVDYGVVIEFTGNAKSLVRLPADYQLNSAETEKLRVADGR